MGCKADYKGETGAPDLNGVERELNGTWRVGDLRGSKMVTNEASDLDVKNKAELNSYENGRDKSDSDYERTKDIRGRVPVAEAALFRHALYQLTPADVNLVSNS